MNELEEKIILNIYNLNYISDVDRIDRALKSLKGIYDAETNYELQQTEVTFDPEKISEQKILSILEHLGYEAELYKE